MPFDRNEWRRKRYKTDPEYRQAERERARRNYVRRKENDHARLRARNLEAVRRYQAKRRKWDMMEHDLEAKCVKYVKTKWKAECRKLDTGRGGKNWPDQAMWLPGGFCIIVEFKLPGNKPTPGQQRRLKRFDDMGYKTFVIRSEQEWEEQVCPWVEQWVPYDEKAAHS